jgi:hypothetical protein
MSRIAQSDVNELSPEQAHQLMDKAFELLRLPIANALWRTDQAGLVNVADLDLTAMAFISLIQSIHNIPKEFDFEVRKHVARQLVDMLLDGWLKR